MHDLEQQGWQDIHSGLADTGEVVAVMPGLARSQLLGLHLL